MKPYVPDLLVFVSPDKKKEIHSSRGENAFLKQKGGKKFQWNERFYPAFVFSIPSSENFFSIGGLGDPGVELGHVDFYEDKGLIKAIDLKKDIPDLEELSRAHRDGTNFPWISSLELDAEKLQIWICNKVLAVINLKDHKVTISRPNQSPSWAKSKQVLSAETKKYQWQSEDRD